MKYMPGFTDFFMSPITGRINLFQFPDIPDDYIIMGGLDDRPYLTPIITDLRLEIIDLRNRIGKLNSEVQQDEQNILDIIQQITEIGSNITSILSDISSIISNIAGIADSISGLISNILDIYDWITGADAEFADLQTQIDAAFEQIGILEADLGALEARMDLAETAIIEINASIEALLEAIAEINAQITGILTAITDIQTAITGILSAITDIQTAITGILSSITDIEANITTIFSSITDINIALGGIGIRLDGFDVSIDGLQAQIDTNISSGLDHLADLQGQIDLGISSGMDHLATLNGQIDDINVQIADLTTSITDITTEIADLTTAIGDGSVTLIGDVTGSGSISTPIATTLTLTLDQVPLALSDISANINKITDLVDPVDPQDAATKNYVDSLGGSIELIGNVLGTGVLGTPFNTDLSSNILTTTGDQTFSYPSGASSTAFALINTCTPTLLTPSNMEFTLENSIGSGFQLNLSSGVAGGSFPDGVFQFYAFNSGGSTLIYTVTSDLVTFNIPVTMTTDMSMAANKITNVVDPTDPQDAATKNYVDGLVGDGTIDITGNVLASGVVGTPFNADLNSTISTTSGGQTFSFPSGSSAAAFSLVSNFTPTILTPSNMELTLQNSIGSGFQLLLSSSYSGGTFPDGVFEFYAFTSGGSNRLYKATADLFTFDIPVTMTTELSMAANEINNLAMNGSPAGTDAVNVDYLNSKIGDGEITLTGAVIGSGFVNDTTDTTLSNFINCTGESQVFSYDAINQESSLVLINLYPYDPTDPSISQLWMKNSDGGGYALQTYTDSASASDGTFYLRQQGFVNQPLFKVDYANGFCPYVNIDMQFNQINNLEMASSPDINDAVNVDYLNSTISSAIDAIPTSITLTGDISGTGSVGGSVSTVLSDFINCTGESQVFSYDAVNETSSLVLINLYPYNGTNPSVNQLWMKNSDGGGFTLQAYSKSASASDGTFYLSQKGFVNQPLFKVDYANGFCPYVNIDMQSNKVINLLNPTSAQDGATKNYVDTRSITLTGSVTGTASLGSSLATTLTTTLNNVPAPTGNVSLNSFKITSLLDPTSAQDGATKNYIDTRSITLTGAVTGTASLGSSLATTLTTVLNSVPAPTGNLSLNSKKITNLLDPTAAQDAATKNYVDSSKACGAMYNTATSGTQSLTLNIWNSLTTTFDTSVNLSNFTKTANNVLKYTGTATVYVTVNACLGFSFSTLANIYFGISKNGGNPSPQATGPIQCTASSLYTSSCTALLQLSTNDTVGVYCFTNVSGTFSNSICSMNVSSVQ